MKMDHCMNEHSSSNHQYESGNYQKSSKNCSNKETEKYGNQNLVQKRQSPSSIHSVTDDVSCSTSADDICPTIYEKSTATSINLVHSETFKSNKQNTLILQQKKIHNLPILLPENNHDYDLEGTATSVTTQQVVDEVFQQQKSTSTFLSCSFRSMSSIIFGSDVQSKENIHLSKSTLVFEQMSQNSKQKEKIKQRKKIDKSKRNVFDLEPDIRNAIISSLLLFFVFACAAIVGVTFTPKNQSDNNLQSPMNNITNATTNSMIISSNGKKNSTNSTNRFYIKKQKNETTATVLPYCIDQYNVTLSIGELIRTNNSSETYNCSWVMNQTSILRQRLCSKEYIPIRNLCQITCYDARIVKPCTLNPLPQQQRSTVYSLF
jgi:hypothetical protein